MHAKTDLSNMQHGANFLCRHTRAPQNSAAHLSEQTEIVYLWALLLLVVHFPNKFYKGKVNFFQTLIFPEMDYQVFMPQILRLPFISRIENYSFALHDN